MSNPLVKGLLFAAVAMLCACRVPADTQSSTMAHVSRIYILNGKKNYREVLSDFVSEHTINFELYDLKDGVVYIDVHGGKILSRQLNEQFHDAGISTSME